MASDGKSTTTEQQRKLEELRRAVARGELDQLEFTRWIDLERAAARARFERLDEWEPFDRWEVSNKLGAIANDLLTVTIEVEGKRRKVLPRSIEVVLPDGPEVDDLDKAALLIQAVADALMGEQDWTSIRAAFDALTGEHRGLQEAYALAYMRCQQTLTKWREIPRLNQRRSESDSAYAARRKGIEAAESRLARALIGRLTDIERGFRQLRPSHVVRAIGTRIEAEEDLTDAPSPRRTRTDLPGTPPLPATLSPERFLYRLARLADVWTTVSRDTFKQAFKDRADRFPELRHAAKPKK